MIKTIKPVARWMDVAWDNDRAFGIHHPWFELHVGLRRGALEVKYLWVHPDVRGQGIAFYLLDLLCRAADKEKVRIRLWAQPFRRCPYRSAYQLAAWYTQFGFAPIREVRKPGHHHVVRMVR